MRIAYTALFQGVSMEKQKPVQLVKAFYVEGFGEVGEANLLYGITEHIRGPFWDRLEVGQSCDVVTRDGPERITRTR